MATTEERFRALEEFRTETLHAYKEMAYEVTILKGLGEDSIKRLAAITREMSDFRAEVNTKLDAILAKLDEPHT